MSRPQGMTSSMMRARNGAGRAARGALAAAALVATLPALATAQTAAPAAPAAPAETPAVPPPGTLSESVAAVVNDSIISTFDLTRRMRLLIATSGVQPTQQNLPQFQREALISLVDERLQLQELRRVEREQKIDIVANDQDIDAEIAQMARPD
jgi:peptidyl-prolyl cis-trans isomerase SurA